MQNLWQMLIFLFWFVFFVFVIVSFWFISNPVVLLFIQLKLKYLTKVTNLYLFLSSISYQSLQSAISITNQENTFFLYNANVWSDLLFGHLLCVNVFSHHPNVAFVITMFFCYFWWYLFTRSWPKGFALVKKKKTSNVDWRVTLAEQGQRKG